MKNKITINSSLHKLIYSFELAIANRNIKDIPGIISDNFMEFGSSGRIFTKADYMESVEATEERLDYEIIDFDIKVIGLNAILATYKSIYKGKKVLRSSIWSSKDEVWQLLFHQGTPAATEDIK